MLKRLSGNLRAFSDSAGPMFRRRLTTIALATPNLGTSSETALDLVKNAGAKTESKLLSSATCIYAPQLGTSYTRSFDDFTVINEIRTFISLSDSTPDKAKIDHFITLYESPATHDTIVSALETGQLSLNEIVDRIQPHNYGYLCTRLVRSGYRFQDNSKEKIVQLRMMQRLAYGTDSDYQTFISCLTGAEEELAKRSFQTQYSHPMCEYMIKRLIDKDYHGETIRFLQYYLERLQNEAEFDRPQDMKSLMKLESFMGFFSLLNNFKLHRNKMPLLEEQLLDSSILQILKKVLLVTPTLEPHHLEDYLKVLYRYLEFNPSPPSFVLKMANHYFITFLSKMDDINLPVLVSYLVTLFPRSEELLESTGLLNMIYNGNAEAGFEPKHDFMNPHVRPELVLPDEYPNLATIDLIYSKLLFDNHPSKIQTRFLFDSYLEEVQKVQRQEPISFHPFASSWHDSIVLETFLRHSLYNLKKPRFASNLLKKYLGSINTSKFHTHAVSKLLTILASQDLTEACSLVNELKQDCKLSSSVFFSIIEDLVRLGDLESAKRYYDYSCENDRIAMNFTQSNVTRFCAEYGWSAPTAWLKNRLQYSEKPLLPAFLSQEETFDSAQVISYLDGVLSRRKQTL
ncbi:DEKNAAC100721 [Brettanomyces naardenensis]|uniref:DEKNAAC100721 n=1 Tax=Brettanomyces naardenensis TaxID=13370 RepID=A0A448YG51_BRENA|nr:DEKNAAC100721 [Brettanomyces naardenensis]